MQIFEPNSFYTNKYEEPMQFHLIDVGEGLMFLVFLPDNKVLLFDCNVTEENEDRVIAYLEKHIPQKPDGWAGHNTKHIDIFINSHRDEDHIRGLKKVHDRFPIKSIWDSGQSGAATQNDNYKYYMQLRRNLIQQYGAGAVCVPEPSHSPFRQFGGISIYCLNSSEEFERETQLQKAARLQHENSLVFSIRYAGKSILFTGDSDWIAWRDFIVPNYEASGLLTNDLLLVSHHGSRTFFTSEENDQIDPNGNPDTTYMGALDLIKPSIALIPCGEFATAHHPNRQALNQYKTKTNNEQVYNTRQLGTITGYIARDGDWAVTPARFANSVNHSSIQINCMTEQRRQASSGASLPADNGWLHFTVSANAGLLNETDQLTITWEVSNRAVDRDDGMHEIYLKADDEEGGKDTFNRQLVYVGRHLLCCTVKNRTRQFKATKIFVVNGVLP